MLVVNILLFATEYGWLMAYLDPGSGSYIIQLLIAGFMGALFMLGVYWRKVKSYLKGLFSKETESSSDE